MVFTSPPSFCPWFLTLAPSRLIFVSLISSEEGKDRQLCLGVTTNTDRDVEVVDRFDLFLGQLQAHSPDKLIEPVVAPDSNDGGGDPFRAARPRDGHFSH